MSDRSLDHQRRRRRLSTAEDARFCDLVEAARLACGVPVAIISLVDAHGSWIAAAAGASPIEASRLAGIKTASAGERGVQEPDHETGSSASDMTPLLRMPQARLHVEVPLFASDGEALGTLHAFGTDLRVEELSADQTAVLRILGRQVAVLVELSDAVSPSRAAMALARRLHRTRNAEARSAAIIDAAIDCAIIATDDDGRVTSWSKGAEHLLGWTKGDMLGERFHWPFTLDDRTSATSPDDLGTARRPQPASGEHWHLRKDGSRFRALSVLTALPEALGGGSVAVLHDVTTEHELRNELTANRERLRLTSLISQSAVWHWELLPRDRIDWSGAARTLSGDQYVDVEGAGAGWIELVHPDDRQGMKDSIRAAIHGSDSEWMQEHRLRQINGAFVSVRNRAHVMRDERGRALRVIGVIDQIDRNGVEHDLTRQAADLAREVEAGRAEIGRLWHASPDLLVVLDGDGQYVRTNPAWLSVLGYHADEVQGIHAAALSHPDDLAILAEALTVARSLQLRNFEQRVRHRDGRYRRISWATAPEEDQIFAVGRDVTVEVEARETLRRTEAALVQAQKVEAVGQLTGGVAHDFNNLLTVIRGSVDLLRRPNLAEDRRAKYIEAIADTADRATRLTSQLLAFARRSALQPQVFDAKASIVAIQPMLRTLTGSRIGATIVLPEQDCTVNTDPSQFDTALVNMAVNARDAMGGEGHLSIVVAIVEQIPAVRAHPPKSGSFVAISMTDSGSGIPAENIGRIFEPFFTTKGVGHGTGLGLSQVFGFAKQANGEVAVESEVGVGTTFTLYLPMCEAVFTADQMLPTGRRLAHGACILIVEDNIEVGEFATQALAELGYQSRWEPNAEAALAELERHQGSYDVVFSDVVMPGKSGVELAREVRNLYPQVAVLLTSGYSHIIAEQGTQGFPLLNKPYSIDELATALHAATERVPDGSVA